METNKDDKEVAQNKVSISKSKQAIKEIVKMLLAPDQLEPFFIFSYFIRLNDNDQNTYTKTIIDFETSNNVESVLLDIMRSNYYEKYQQNPTMKID